MRKPYGASVPPKRSTKQSALDKASAKQDKGARAAAAEARANEGTGRAARPESYYEGVKERYKRDNPTAVDAAKKAVHTAAVASEIKKLAAKRVQSKKV